MAHESSKSFALRMNPPPFLVSFSSLGDYFKTLPDEVRTLYGKDFESLVEKRLPPVVSIRCLAALFGYSVRFTGALYFRSERYYRTFTIPKGKKQRIINAPRVALKVVQKWFGFHLEQAVQFDDCVHGFVRGRSAVSAARVHCGSEWVYSLDISDFFPKTPVQKITAAVAALGYSQHGAQLIAKLCCYNGGLAQGSPASPVLSNLAFRSVDAELASLAKKYGIRYTRYADDVVFSGVGKCPKALSKKAKAAIESQGWEIAVSKERLARLPARLKVHGLLVHGEKPRLTKGYRNKVRAFEHLMAIGSVRAEDSARLQGHIAYARSVDTLR